MGLLPTDSKASKLLQLVNEGAASAPFRIEWDRWEALRVEEIKCQGTNKFSGTALHRKQSPPTHMERNRAGIVRQAISSG